MKFLLAVILYTTLAAMVFGESKNWGERAPGDNVVFSENALVYDSDGELPTYFVKFPRPGEYNDKVITAVKVVDTTENGNGFTPFLQSGGPGSTNVQVLLQGPEGTGFTGTVEVYGQ
ncbi:uncharacterized protein LOC142240350 [Haematobia irritans]|uniref:uncharacterized protein LOC142240350 n=1 Tax=Haematobia irritans TaxID=7368 RepID=UPI003F4FCBF6